MPRILAWRAAANCYISNLWGKQKHNKKPLTSLPSDLFSSLLTLNIEFVSLHFLIYKRWYCSTNKTWQKLIDAGRSKFVFILKFVQLHRLCGCRKYPYPPQGGSSKIPRGGGCVQHQKFKGKYEAKLEFPVGCGGSNQETLHGGSMDIFWNNTSQSWMKLVVCYAKFKIVRTG